MNTMDVLVVVKNQRLQISSDLTNFVEGSLRFVKFIFELPDYWKEQTNIRAMFFQDDVIYYSELTEENRYSAFLPHEIIEGICKLTLVAGKRETTIATAGYLKLKIDPNLKIREATSEEISASIYGQILNRITEIESDLDAMDVKLVNMDEEIDNVETRFNKKISNITELINTKETNLIKKIEDADNALSDRITTNTQNISSAQSAIDTINNTTIVNINNSISSIEGTVEANQLYVDTLRDTYDDEFESLTTRVTDLENAVFYKACVIPVTHEYLYNASPMFNNYAYIENIDLTDVKDLVFKSTKFIPEGDIFIAFYNSAEDCSNDLEDVSVKKINLPLFKEYTLDVESIEGRTNYANIYIKCEGYTTARLNTIVNTLRISANYHQSISALANVVDMLYTNILTINEELYGVSELIGGEV